MERIYFLEKGIENDVENIYILKKRMLGKIIENKKSRKLGMENDENILFENLLKKEMEKKLSIIFYFSFFMMLYSLHHFLYLL